jgi:hypothetical protein
MSFGPRLEENFCIASKESSIFDFSSGDGFVTDSSTIKILSKITNNYCIYLSAYNLEYAMQLNILQKNIKEKYPKINFYFAFQENVIKDLKLPDNFISLEEMHKNKNNFAVCEEIYINPKGNGIKDYFDKNDIKFQ